MILLLTLASVISAIQTIILWALVIFAGICLGAFILTSGWRL